MGRRISASFSEDYKIFHAAARVFGPDAYPALARYCWAPLARLSQPVRLSRKATRDGQGGVLTIKVEGAMALELQHLAPQIIERLNSYYGYPAIGKLNIIQGPDISSPCARCAQTTQP